VTEPELWTTAEVAEYLGASSAGSGRKTLSRLGLAPVSRQPGRDGQNLYDATEVRAAKARMPGRGNDLRTQIPAVPVPGEDATTVATTCESREGIPR
jgi:hypothetical protein